MRAKLWTARLAAVAGVALAAPARAAEAPTPDMLRVLAPQPEGPSITPYLAYQIERAWAFDAVRRERFARATDEEGLRALQQELRGKLLRLIGGLPETKTPLDARVTGSIPMEGYRIDKLVFESLPGIHVTALVYVPEGPMGKRPAVLLACGHSPVGKAHPGYQEIAVRLARRGYVVLCWDPVGQGERSQFWDAARGRSRYNLVCGEHAVLGNFATIAGTSLVRYMVWDGIRAIDYLLSRDDVDAQRIAITGTSGGGFQSLWIGALDPRVAAILPSCFPTALPMRMANRIFEDPDSDPEQDPPGLVSEGIDHAGLLLLAYPRPLHVSAAVLDFFPIEGTRQAMREVAAVYRRLGHGDRVALSEGFHKHQYSPENQARAFGFLDRVFGRPPATSLGDAKVLPAEAVRCTPSGQVRVDLRGRSLRRGDPRGHGLASARGACARRALPRREARERRRLARRAVLRGAATRRDRLGIRRQRPRRRGGHRPLSPAPQRRPRDAARARAPAERRAARADRAPQPRGKDRPDGLACRRGAAGAGPRGRLVRPARARRDAPALQGDARSTIRSWPRPTRPPPTPARCPASSPTTSTTRSCSAGPISSS